MNTSREYTTDWITFSALAVSLIPRIVDDLAYLGIMKTRLLVCTLLLHMVNGHIPSSMESRHLERRTGENKKNPPPYWPPWGRTQQPPIVGAKRINKKSSLSSGAIGSREPSPSSSDSDVDPNQVPETSQKPYAAAVGKGHGTIAKVVDGREEVASLWPGRTVTKATTNAKPVAAGVNLTRGGKAATHISGQNVKMALATGPRGKGKSLLTVTAISLVL